MARGSNIIVSADPGGKFTEGIIAAGQTPKPGVVMQKVHATALVGGRHTYTPFTSADGVRPLSAIWVLLPDRLQGKTATDAYAAGDRCFLYSPLPGEELNMILQDVSGTADDHTAGEQLIVDSTTGKLLATTGSPECEPFTLLETVTDPVADTLAWVEYTGY